MEESDINVLSTMLTWIIHCFVIFTRDSEAKRLHLIAPILWTVVHNLSDVSVLIEAELCGRRVDVQGHFEFVLVRGNKRICILEAKKDNFEQGMAQALLGCEAAADRDNTHEVYAVVTNGEKWTFARNLDEKILVDDLNTIVYDTGAPDAAQVKTIARKLRHMLSS
jgi:hypothetical protein